MLFQVWQLMSSQTIAIAVIELWPAKIEIVPRFWKTDQDVMHKI